MAEHAKRALPWRMIVALAVFLAALPSAQSQRGPLGRRDPHVGYVYPAGAQRGTQVDVTVGGQYLNGVSGAIVSGDGVEATVRKHTKPLSPKERNEIREIFETARKQIQSRGNSGRRRGQGRNLEAVIALALEMGADPDQLEAFAKFRKQQSDPKRQPNPQLSESVTLEVTVAADAALGERELRLSTPAGLTSPLRFHVGQWTEYCENEPNNKLADSGHAASLPATFNGQILPGDIDQFSFTARRGERLVVGVKARKLIPYLADAVPGWFQATLALFDAEGNELAYVDDYRFHPDPVLYFVIPKRGQYILRISDAIYRGREDFVYRISAGSFPFVTSVFPLGGRVGEATRVELHGWNLRSKSLTLPAQLGGTGIFTIALDADRPTYNQVPFAVDTLLETREEEPNDAAENAQPIGTPAIINGRVDRPGDLDIFRFPGQSGRPLVVEVIARRLNSPLDSVVQLTDDQGQPVAASDDQDDRGSGLVTHHADSRFQIVLPKQGDYYLHLGDNQGQGGPGFGYRLRVSGPRPDFGLRIVPSTINAPAGATVPVTLYALRSDGFAGNIRLALTDAPPGFVLSGAWIPAGHDTIRLTLSVPPKLHDAPMKLQMEGRAMIGGREVRRTAVPADDKMQAFIYRHLVPAQDWMVSITNRGGRRPRFRVAGDRPLRIPLGGIATVELSGRQKIPVDRLRFELSQPPEGIVLEDVSAFGDGLAIQLRADSQKMDPNLKGNVLINVSMERGVQPKNSKQRGQKRRIPWGTLPAIPFEMIAAEAATRSESKPPIGIATADRITKNENDDHD